MIVLFLSLALPLAVSYSLALPFCRFAEKAHFSRKCYSTVKQQLENDAGFSPLILSEMDTIFMATYAAGNIINGKLGDTFNPTTILSIGLFGVLVVGRHGWRYQSENVGGSCCGEK